MGSIFWAISTGIFAVLEVVIPGLVTIWLALASLIVTILTLFFTDVKIEFLIFSVLSMIFVLFTRPILQKYLEKSSPNFNAKFVGTTVKIVKILENENEENFYEVKFKGAIWTAKSMDKFSEGEMAKIENFEGNKIVLTK